MEREVFDQEVTCTFNGETYRVRDNGTVFRCRKDDGRLRPLDEKWTFGRADKKVGYMFISSTRVHHIVATAFHGAQPSKGHVVDHIDTNRRNNRPENLRWVTRLENILMNPITVRRLIIKYGSIENFLSKLGQPSSGQRNQGFEWMRSVSKEEAETTLSHLLEWAKREGSPSGGTLGEWIYRSRSNQDIEELKNNSLPDHVYAYTASIRKRLEGRGITLLSYVKSLISGKANFRCSNGHEWRTIPRLVGEGQGCPVCGIGERNPEEIRQKIKAGVICLLTHPDKPGFVNIGLGYGTLEEVCREEPWGDWEIHRHRTVEEVALAESTIWELLGETLPHVRKPIRKDLSDAEDAFRKLIYAMRERIALAEKAKETIPRAN